MLNCNKITNYIRMYKYQTGHLYQNKQLLIQNNICTDTNTDCICLFWMVLIYYDVSGLYWNLIFMHRRNCIKCFPVDSYKLIKTVMGMNLMYAKSVVNNVCFMSTWVQVHRCQSKIFVPLVYFKAPLWLEKYIK